MRLVDDLDDIQFKIGYYTDGEWCDHTMTGLELALTGGDLQGTELFYAFQEEFTLEKLLAMKKGDDFAFNSSRDRDSETAVIVRL